MKRKILSFNDWENIGVRYVNFLESFVSFSSILNKSFNKTNLKKHCKEIEIIRKNICDLKDHLEDEVANSFPKKDNADIIGVFCKKD